MSSESKPDRKPWWRSKTVWLGLWQFLIGVLIVLADSELTEGRLEAWLLIIAGTLTAGLRFLTTEPIEPIHFR